MAPKTELLPCPFCGASLHLDSEVRDALSDLNGLLWARHPRVDGCPLSGCDLDGFKPSQWNHRAALYDVGWTDEDQPLPEDDAIGAAHPIITGNHAMYMEAARLVHAKRSKGALVDLVNWLLAVIELKKAEKFQPHVLDWMLECFGPKVSADATERNHRFLEEALELVQACGCSISEAHQLVDYVFDRPAGEKWQEVGGVMVTLAALCNAQNVLMSEAGTNELRRCWSRIDEIRAKHATKPKHSPLPGKYANCHECDFEIIDGVHQGLGCLMYSQFGLVAEINAIKKALSTGKCDEFRERPKQSTGNVEGAP